MSITIFNYGAISDTTGTKRHRYNTKFTLILRRHSDIKPTKKVLLNWPTANAQHHPKRPFNSENNSNHRVLHNK